MTNTIILLGILIACSLFVGFAMETYKKVIRDSKSQTVENRVVAFLLSLLMGFLTYEAVDMSQITSMIRDTVWVALAYGVVIYVLQYEACMKIWKPMVKRWLKDKINE